ncbi:unnamed protein product [Cylindrotheca closterium]|uniref:Plastid lipid-associated protein/fibrillin conserved domain-containing protein n=1 Tax=Cylindrotheca closterium TaxID=2856 RepID=A0AAD2CDU1_9STRA|nr:unnamed protein product [Cylindrotheca closterium]
MASLALEEPIFLGSPRFNSLDDDQLELSEEYSDIYNFDIPASSIVRPTAMRILNPDPLKSGGGPKSIRPVSRRVSEQFYNDAYRQGISMRDTNDAAMMAQEWHRKWTHQEETHHTHVDRDFYQFDSRLSSHHGIVVDRSAGASNPFSPPSYVSGSSFGSENLKRSLDTPEESLSEAELEALLLHPEDRLEPLEEEKQSTKRRNLGKSKEVDREPAAPAAKSFMFHPTDLSLNPHAVPPQEVKMEGRGNSPSPPPHQTQDAMTPIDREAEVHYVEDEDSPFESVAHVSSRQDEEVHFVEEGVDEITLDENPIYTFQKNMTKARDNLLQTLEKTKGDVESEEFKDSLDVLLQHHSSTLSSALLSGQTLDGMWLQLSKPTYFGCLGENEAGDPLYTMGRMSFDMFSPTNIICSIQGNFNPIEAVSEAERAMILQAVPKSLRDEVENDNSTIRTYHIVTAFTIEPGYALRAFPEAPNKDVARPIKGIMTTYGYSLPDPKVPNRHSIWFTGGKLQPSNDIADIKAWNQLFTLHPPKHTFGERAKLLAVQLLMGATVPTVMDKNGQMNFAFTRPIGGHGVAYVDVIYMDGTVRVVRGHRGTVMAFSRLNQDDL